MKKILALLLLVSAVVGMTMPAMANPSIEKIVNNEQVATNWANSEIVQKLENHGDLVNTNDQIALGGDAEANSKAKGSANAKDQSEHDVGAGDDAEDNSESGAANVLSGNAVSGASAYGGDADNGDNFQINAVVQVAIAEITTEQDIEQNIEEDEELELEIEDSILFENNGIELESERGGESDFEVEL